LSPLLAGTSRIVTGGNCGIGKEAARVLLSKDAHVYLAGRDEANGREVVEELKQATGKESIELVKLDLGSVESTLAAAEGFKKYDVITHCGFGLHAPGEAAYSVQQCVRSQPACLLPSAE
jgi:retinol dehydrogenase 12